MWHIEHCHTWTPPRSTLNSIINISIYCLFFVLFRICTWKNVLFTPIFFFNTLHLVNEWSVRCGSVNEHSLEPFCLYSLRRACLLDASDCLNRCPEKGKVLQSPLFFFQTIMSQQRCFTLQHIKSTDILTTIVWHCYGWCFLVPLSME